MFKSPLLFPQLPLRNTTKIYLHTGKFPLFHSSHAQTLFPFKKKNGAESMLALHSRHYISLVEIEKLQSINPLY